CSLSASVVSSLFGLRPKAALCTVNPAQGHEAEPTYQILPPRLKKKVLVVGRRTVRPRGSDSSCATGP
ncbi:hypothetical protein ACFL2Q_15470, partial [Thermodesulfobacteriota bacterium]